MVKKKETVILLIILVVVLLYQILLIIREQLTKDIKTINKHLDTYSDIKVIKYE